MDFDRKIGCFKAISEDGTVYTVIESQVIVLVDLRLPPTSTRKSYRTTTEENLTCIDENTFKFDETNEVIKRILTLTL